MDELPLLRHERRLSSQPAPDPTPARSVLFSLIHVVPSLPRQPCFCCWTAPEDQASSLNLDNPELGRARIICNCL